MISNLEIGNPIHKGYEIRAIREAVDRCLVLVATSAFELRKHLSSVTMHPVGNGREWHYEAEGAWDQLYTDRNSLQEEQQALDSYEGHLRMVAGAGFEPSICTRS